MNQNLPSMEEPLKFKPNKYERQLQFEAILKKLLPLIGSKESEVILAEVMVALKLDRSVGLDISEKDYHKIQLIKKSILNDKVKRAEALKLSKKCLGN